MRNLDKKINDSYTLEFRCKNEGWSRYYLVFIRGNNGTPVAEVDIIRHPGQDGMKSHDEIKFNFRDDVKFIIGNISIEKNGGLDPVGTEEVENVLKVLEEHAIVSRPLDYFVCVIHNQSYGVLGDIYT
jgi:hypothetical protein